MIKTIPKKTKYKEAKLSEETLQIAEKRREAKGNGERERYIHWNAKVGSQEIPGAMGKFGLGVQNEAGQRFTQFCQENALVIANTLFQKHKR